MSFKQSRRQPRVRIPGGVPCLGYRFLRASGSIGHGLFAHSREHKLRSSHEREHQRESAPQELRNAVLAHVKTSNLTGVSNLSRVGGGALARSVQSSLGTTNRTMKSSVPRVSIYNRTAICS